MTIKVRKSVDKLLIGRGIFVSVLDEELKRLPRKTGTYTRAQHGHRTTGCLQPDPGVLHVSRRRVRKIDRTTPKRSEPMSTVGLTDYFFVSLLL